MTYNDIMNFIHRDSIEDGDQLWKFRSLLAHRGPLNHRDEDYKGSSYNLVVEWEDGTQVSMRYFKTLIRKHLRLQFRHQHKPVYQFLQ